MPPADPAPYTLEVERHAARQLAERLPEAVAGAVVNFLTGDLLSHPRRVGKPLVGALAGLWSARRGEYRIVYSIDEARRVVTVVEVAHRRDVYRGRPG